ncbi:MAG: protein kinase domain-containing protein, partial [Terriglobales bacterium]
YMPNGSMDRKPETYKGSVFRALKAFRSLVEAVAALHKDKIIHRDIKPANVFALETDELVLGDFGIVYLPNQAERLTTTDEKVGPRDYMPQWGDLGERLEHVRPNFDVYMLGKLLWCMVSGRLKLPREYHKKPAYDVTKLFPNDPNMRVIGDVIEKCVVEEPQDCLESGRELLALVDDNLANLERGLPALNRDGKLVLPCRICGRGSYQEHYPEGHFRLSSFDQMNRPTNPVLLRVFVCNVCTHHELFAPNFPDEAAKKK